MLDLAQIKKVSLEDLHRFLVQDHTSFTVLTASLKHIERTNRLTVSLTKNSAKNFYLGKTKANKPVNEERPDPQDDCLTDAQNCQFFQHFDSKEKKLYLRFTDKIEANFAKVYQQLAQPANLFLTLTFNTTHDNLTALNGQLDSGKSRLSRLRSELDSLRNQLGGKQSLATLLGLEKLSFTDKVMIIGGIVLVIFLLKS